jgi:hypothetical protein
VEYLVDQDVWRLLGSFSFLRQDAAGTVWRFDFDHRAQLLLRRQHVRAPLDLGVRLWTPAGRLETHTLDVSGGGLRLPAGVPAEIGQRLGFMLSITGTAVIRGTAEVVRIDPTDGSAGLLFTDITPSDRTLLVLAVYDELRRSKSCGPGIATPSA